MINNVVLNGRLTEDCDLRYTGSGKAVGNITIAVNRDFTNQQGEREADFINCVVWGKPAETFANYTRKGSLVSVAGRLQSRNYENQQGQKVYVTEVVVEHFDFLESKDQLEFREQKRREQQQQGGNTQQNQQQNQQDYNNAANNIANSQQQQAQNNQQNYNTQQNNNMNNQQQSPQNNNGTNQYGGKNYQQ
ncbi:hypothetical protein A5819_003495 [Enterococcus sp. 7E2_DIV0204]|uniref:single-stranded DNA-binding protein n=1 Tax=unclassified Enterococcus TaxID=2608891 RepID=UPI000A34168C|nr:MULTISPECIES: single-stranded DNA-binding protein [unclassified Enterococcus]OTN83945.1 hypothetical protein A5819_003495 [Enterococcus sp. 7E2_DIV0204]OTP46853.1 hypothetical protein A5884_003731 [Enterococcus sp. 7D2_DIV0200]